MREFHGPEATDCPGLRDRAQQEEAPTHSYPSNANYAEMFALLRLHAEEARPRPLSLVAVGRPTTRPRKTCRQGHFITQSNGVPVRPFQFAPSSNGPIPALKGAEEGALHRRSETACEIPDAKEAKGGTQWGTEKGTSVANAAAKSHAVEKFAGIVRVRRRNRGARRVSRTRASQHATGP